RYYRQVERVGWQTLDAKSTTAQNFSIAPKKPSESVGTSGVLTRGLALRHRHLPDIHTGQNAGGNLRIGRQVLDVALADGTPRSGEQERKATAPAPEEDLGLGVKPACQDALRTRKTCYPPGTPARQSEPCGEVWSTDCIARRIVAIGQGFRSHGRPHGARNILLTSPVFPVRTMTRWRKAGY